MNNWQASNRKQEKSKKSPRKHQQWLKRHTLLVQRLKKGINCEGSGNRVFFVSVDSALA